MSSLHNKKNSWPFRESELGNFGPRVQDHKPDNSGLCTGDPHLWHIILHDCPLLAKLTGTALLLLPLLSPAADAGLPMAMSLPKVSAPYHTAFKAAPVVGDVQKHRASFQVPMLVHPFPAQTKIMILTALPAEWNISVQSHCCT